MLSTVGSLTLAMVQAGQLPRTCSGRFWLSASVSAVLFVIHERTTPEPMLPLELWRHNRVVVVGSLGSFAAGAMMTGITAFLPAYVQGAMGLSPMTGGLVLGAMSVSWAFASVIGGGSWSAPPIGWWRFSARSLSSRAADPDRRSTRRRPPFHRARLRSSSGIGIGFCMSVFIVSIQASVPWHQRGAATSSTMFLRFMGQVIGVSGCGAVLNATILRMDPNAGRAMDRMLDPLSRAALPPSEVAHLTES